MPSHLPAMKWDDDCWSEKPIPARARRCLECHRITTVCFDGDRRCKGSLRRHVFGGRRPFYDHSQLIFMVVFSFLFLTSFTIVGGVSLADAHALPVAAADDSSSSPVGSERSGGEQEAATQKPAGNPPVITENPLDITVPKNDPVTLNCKASGKPQPQIIWYKDGEQLSTAAEESSSHRVLLSTGALFFLRVQPGGTAETGSRKNQKSDAGIYWCVARNAYGEARSKNASLRIAYLKDEFRVQPRNVQTIVGQEAILECSPPKGYPEPVVSWKKDNRELRLDENDERRRIVQPLSSNQQSSGRQSPPQQQQGVGNLIITNVDSSDAGAYTCVAKNMVGIRESSPARLTVYAKPKIIRKPENVTATLNEDVLLTCRMDGDPQPVITWRKKWSPPGARFPDGRATPIEGPLGAPIGLRIERVMASDEGEYECSGRNPAGSTEASAYLTVYSPPVFTVQPKDRTVEEGTLLNVECDASGKPTPTKFWSREGNQDPLFPGVSSSDRRMEVTENGTLRIYNVRASDEGYYICSALNNIGSSSSKMYLKVVGGAVVQPPPPPLILRGPANQTLPEMSLAILPCTASGRTVPRLMWLKNGVELENNVRYTIDTSGALQLHDLRITDSGIYTCRVYNEDGEDSWSAALTVAEHTNPDVVFLRMAEPSTFPSAPGRPHPLNVSDTSVYLEWEMPTHSGASAIVGYRLYYFGFGSGDKKDERAARWISVIGGAGDSVSGPAQIRGTRYLVQRLLPSTSYIFVARAENQHGVSEPSPYSAIVRTKNTGLAGGSDARSADFDLELARTRLTSSQLVQLREVAALNATAVKLTWRTLHNEPLINGYYVRWQAQDERERGGSLNVPGGSSTTSTVVGNLRPFTAYKFFVRPYYRTVEGTPSNMYDATTKEAPPNVSPVDVQVRLMNLTTMRISWLPPPADGVNGILKGYEIVVLGNETEFDRNLTTSERAASVTLYRLITGMTYRIRVAAKTDAGVGVFHGEEAVTMDEATFRLHLAMDKGGDARSDASWTNSWWFITLLCCLAWLFLLGVILGVYWCCCKRIYKKGILMNMGRHGRSNHQHSRFGGSALQFIKINDGSVAREALWMDHQPEQFYARNSVAGGNNSTLLMNGHYGGNAGNTQPSLDGNAIMDNNFAASTFMANLGGNGKGDEKQRYMELNQMNMLTGNGGQFYQPPATPIYHQVSPPSPTPYATTTLVMNAHRQRLLEQQQRADGRLYPSSTLHNRNGGHRDEQQQSAGHRAVYQAHSDLDGNGMKRASSLRSDQQLTSNQLTSGISPPHTDVSYVSSSGGSGSGKLTQRNKQPVLFDFLPPPPAQPPPSGPPAGYEAQPVRDIMDESEEDTGAVVVGRNGRNKLDKCYYGASPVSVKAERNGPAGKCMYQPSTSAIKQAVPTPRTRLKGRQQEMGDDLRKQHGQYRFAIATPTLESPRHVSETDSCGSPPAYEQAMRCLEGNGGCSPVPSDCTSRQVQVNDSPRTSCYTGCQADLDAMASKRSSMLASLATSDDGDNMIFNGVNMGNYGPATSSCNSDADDDQSVVNDRQYHGRPQFTRRGQMAKETFFAGSETEFSERDDADDDVGDDDDDEYETHFLPPAEFTQALASRSLLSSMASGANQNTSPTSSSMCPGGAQYRSQPPMGVSASTMLTSQHGAKPVISPNGGGRLSSIPRRSPAAAPARGGNHRTAGGPTDLV